MQFASSQQPLNGHGKVSPNWDAFNDPALLATLPAAALMYRRHDVSEAKAAYVFSPKESVLFDTDVSSGTSVALRTATEKGMLEIALPRTPELPG